MHKFEIALTSFCSFLFSLFYAPTNRIAQGFDTKISRIQGSLYSLTHEVYFLVSLRGTYFRISFVSFSLVSHLLLVGDLLSLVTYFILLIVSIASSDSCLPSPDQCGSSGLTCRRFDVMISRFANSSYLELGYFQLFRRYFFLRLQIPDFFGSGNVPTAFMSVFQQTTVMLNLKTTPYRCNEGHFLLSMLLFFLALQCLRGANQSD